MARLLGAGLALALAGCSSGETSAGGGGADVAVVGDPVDVVGGGGAADVLGLAPDGGDADAGADPEVEGGDASLGDIDVGAGGGDAEVVGDDAGGADAGADGDVGGGVAGPDADAEGAAGACVVDLDCAPHQSADLCRGVLTCQDGVCSVLAGTVITCDTSGDSACSQTVCEAETGMCVAVPAVDGVGCDDGDACTGGDVCAGGVCVGEAIDCSDGDACTVDGCELVSGCVYEAVVCDDGDLCTLDGCELVSGCVFEAVVCDDGNVCTVDACDPGSGACGSDAAVCEDDGNVCTDEACVVGVGCVSTPNAGVCDDGDACTTDDVCSGGACSGTPPSGLTCSDGDPCTADTCDPVVGCVHVQIEAACDDGDPCTVGDVCSGGACAGVAKVCDDGEVCTEGLCDPASGACVWIAVAGACDDGSVCTVGDVCSGGVCGGAPVVCPEGDLCMDAWCDPVLGCQAVPNEAACDDGDACTVGDVCSGGACVGVEDGCDDGDACTVDGCEAEVGCVWAAVTCDDGDACTVDGCDGDIGCVFAGVDCDDSDVCTVESCDAVAGCQHAAIDCGGGVGCGVEACDPAGGCPAVCDPGAAPCAGDEDCSNDEVCTAGPEGTVCIPWDDNPDGGWNPECHKVVPPGVFFPALQCEWVGPPEGDPYPNHFNVLGSPTVVHLPMAPTLDPLASPGAHGQIVFISYAGTDGGFESGSCCGIIRVLDGATCEQIYTLGDHAVTGGSNPAIGDLDLAPDGSPEIVAFAEGGGLVAFRYDVVSDEFVLWWHSTEPDGVTLDTFAAGNNRWVGPSLADITGDGRPEVLFEGNVYSADGVKLAPGLGWIGYQLGIFPMAADVDLDGAPEVMLGAVAHRFDEATQTLVPEDYVMGGVPPGGHVALADFGPWGVEVGLPAAAAEVAHVHTGTVSIRTLTGALLFGPYALPGGGQGGPPTIGDFDGDGEPEVAAAGAAAYTIFDPGCVGQPPPAGCEGDGVLWSKASQDSSSNRTGSSVFDFEADGQAEAVYGDECFVRVYEGTSGDVLYSGPRASCTWHEQPVIADVDGDFRTEIVIGSNNNCGISCPPIDPIFSGLRCDKGSQCVSGVCTAGFCRCTGDAECVEGYGCVGQPAGEEDGLGSVCRPLHDGEMTGIRVYNDFQDHWVNSRAIWNQHAYFVTNVDENGRVPPRDEVVTNWTQDGLNDFRRNAQGDAPALAAPDLTVRPAQPPLVPFVCDPDYGTLTLTVEVCNRGLITAAAGAEVGFYAEAPAPGVEPVCVAQTAASLLITKCVPVSCTVAVDALPGGAFHATVDDPVNGTGAYLECVEGNNLGFVEGVVCGP